MSANSVDAGEFDAVYEWGSRLVRLVAPVAEPSHGERERSRAFDRQPITRLPSFVYSVSLKLSDLLQRLWPL
jgi:hypothetical protein